MQIDAAANREYARGLARAFGGALLFAFPLLMTMEMWELGAAVDRPRLLIFLLASLPLLLGLSYFAGFEATFRLKDEVLDAFAALGVGILLSAAALAVFGVLDADHGLEETVGKIALCAVPGAMGALLAGKQLEDRAVTEAWPKADGGYAGELFVMLVGAVYLAFNVAPTEEMTLIAHKMSPHQALALIAASLAILHLIVYRLGFPGEGSRLRRGGFAGTFLAFTAPGYAIAIAISLYALWTFGRLDGTSLSAAAAMTAVLAFPAALGCATARLVI
ncbi:MAG: TIGR02587 family membrane protein [Phenylobacterium sp.]|uniref:TIGR02587 family membrane protein n=1 Tax=Phenylobacterium sp. TaxID=1871053 RepID=UPI00391C9035